MSTLIVKHIPLVMSDDSIKEFFQHYGAVDIKIMQGKMVLSLYYIISLQYTHKNILLISYVDYKSNKVISNIFLNDFVERERICDVQGL